MTRLILEFLFSAGAVALAGVFLTKFADAISDKTKLGKALVGSIILAGGTSLPELLVDVNAIRSNMPDLAVGDLLGSSLINLLILSVADLLHSNPQRLLSKTAIVHSITASLTILVTGIVAVSLFTGIMGKSLSVLEIGIGPIAVLIVYIFGLRLISRNQTLSKTDSPGPNASMSLKTALMGYCLCAGVIFFAAPYLSDSAGEIADVTGLGKTFIGTILVAFCTSLPELVSTITAVRIGAPDLALGNIFGSNAFNMLLFIPLDFFHKGPLLSEVSQVHLLSAISVMVITSIFILGQLNQVEKSSKKLDLDAITNIALVLLTFGLLYVFKD